MRNPHTLLTRFFGLHRVKPYKSAKTHFVVMGNIFGSDLLVHEVYDLKVPPHDLTPVLQA